MSKSDILRRELMRKGMTHQDLADEIPYSRSRVSQAVAGYRMKSEFWKAAAGALQSKQLLDEIEAELRAKINILEALKQEIEKAPAGTDAVALS